ncbi:MAG: hemolysin III family protein [Clostridia bacterium]|nr:hemolysin III family protein [Clostridia bacterium]
MKRTPIDNRPLPDYTRGEEIMNMVTHIAGGAFGIIVLVIGVLLSAHNRNPWGIVCASLYAISMIWLYTISSIYHGLKPGRAKKVLQVLDHCTIYALIAGTYMPVLLVGLRPLYPVLAWICFGIEIVMLALATTLTAVDLGKFRTLSMTCYICMGWLIIVAAPQTIKAITTNGFLWLLSGGIAYTVGAVLYGIGKKKRWFHSIFHLFVLLGSLLQATSILLYVLR